METVRLENTVFSKEIAKAIESKFDLEENASKACAKKKKKSSAFSEPKKQLSFKDIIERQMRSGEYLNYKDEF